MQAFSSSAIWAELIAYGVAPIVLCFFPLAGFLADTIFGHYKTVIVSLYIIMPPMVLLVVPEGFIIPSITACNVGDIYSYIFLATQNLLTKVLFLSGLDLGSILILVMVVGFIGFTANVIQFGMDQLHDSPGEDQSLFMRWFMWLYYISVFLESHSNFTYNAVDDACIYGAGLLLLIPLLVTVLLIVTLCVARHRRRWFLIEPGRVNPYKLVSRVTKFASQHKIPVPSPTVRMSYPQGWTLARTSMEDPSPLKRWKMSKPVLFSFGTVFFLDFIANSMLPMFAKHNIPYYGRYINFSHYRTLETLGHSILVANGLLSPLLIVVCIPLYLCLIRPFMSRYVPGMLKRMGLGILLVLLSLIATLIL